MRNPYKNSVDRPEMKRPLRQLPVAGSFERGNEPSGS
jgi:hypothetical protein